VTLEPITVPSGVPGASVVMTVYNDFRFLDAAVDSVLGQEFRDLELIIVDDGTGEDARFDALHGATRASASSSTRPISALPRRPIAASISHGAISSFVWMRTTSPNRRGSGAWSRRSPRILGSAWSAVR